LTCVWFPGLLTAVNVIQQRLPRLRLRTGISLERERRRNARRASDTGLLDEFHAWLHTVGDPYPDDRVANATAFVDWRHSHSTGDLGAFDEDDIVEFLLDWSPRRITMPADAASWFCASIGATQAVLARAAPTKIADELLAKSNVNRSTTHDARR
jgi:hypothetical protein